MYEDICFNLKIRERMKIFEKEPAVLPEPELTEEEQLPGK